MRLVLQVDDSGDQAEIMEQVAREIAWFGRMDMREARDPLVAHEDAERMRARARRFAALAREIRWAIREGWTVPQ